MTCYDLLTFIISSLWEKRVMKFKSKGYDVNILFIFN